MILLFFTFGFFEFIGLAVSESPWGVSISCQALRRKWPSKQTAIAIAKVRKSSQSRLDVELKVEGKLDTI